MNKSPLGKNTPTFSDFLQYWKNEGGEKELGDYSHYIASNPLIENLLSLGPCFVYMLNYRTMKYIYLSGSVKNILGYNPREFRDAGPEFIIPFTHPDDYQELMTSTFPKILEFYNSTPIEDRKKIRCTYDYRVKRTDGKYIRLLQQTMMIEMDNEGKPLVDIGIVSDITEYKKSNIINLSLTKYDQQQTMLAGTIIEQEVIKKDRVSERELEILKLLMQGYSSKKIADELHISVNTVRNHRQNLMEKTHTKNIAELITFAMSNSLI